MISVQHVHVSIEGQPILHDVSFDVERGTVAGYVGPNGAGKTTTLRLLTGALKPDGGQVWVGDVNIAEDVQVNVEYRLPRGHAVVHNQPVVAEAFFRGDEAGYDE